MSDLTNRYYVYHLVDPRNGEVFYVGKGTGDRIRHHVREAKGRKFKNARKCERIISIIDSGNVVIERIAFDGLSENAAYTLEAVEIDRIGQDALTNLKHGIEPAIVKTKKKAEQFIADMLWFLDRVADQKKEEVISLINEMRENLTYINKEIATTESSK